MFSVFLLTFADCAGSGALLLIAWIDFSISTLPDCFPCTSLKPSLPISLRPDVQKSRFGRFAEILLRRSAPSSVCIDISCATLAVCVPDACCTLAFWLTPRIDVRERSMVGFIKLLWLGFLVLTFVVLTFEVLMSFSLFEFDGRPIRPAATCAAGLG